MRLSKRVWCYPELPSLHAFHILPYLLAPLTANCFSCLRAPPPILDTYQKAEGSSASLLPPTKACQGKSIRCERLNLQCSLCSLRCYDLPPGVFAFQFLAFCGVKHFDAGIPLYLLIHGLHSIVLGPQGSG